MSVPSRLAFSPDDRWLTYLHNPTGDLTQQLYALDTETGRSRAVFVPTEPSGEKESLEEQLRKERARELAGGVTRYWWARERSRMLMPAGAGLHVLDWPDGTLRPLLGSFGSEIVDPRLSPDGSVIAFVSNGDVHIADVERGAVRRLTRQANPPEGLTFGLAEFIAQEEMGRRHGMWWSRDSTRLAWTSVDESAVDLLRIAHLGSDGAGPASEEVHRYPFAGDANAVVRLAVASIRGGDVNPVWLDLGAVDGYLCRVAWMPDGSLVVETQHRNQCRIDLWRFDPDTGARTHLWAEEGEPWLNLHNMFEPLGQGGFVWASERSGYRHLWLHGPDGPPERPLTHGDWVVDALSGVDESTGRFWYCANSGDPRQRHLHEGRLAGGEPRRITEGSGTHQILIDHAHRRFVDSWSSLERPPAVTLRGLTDDAPLAVVHDGVDPRIERFGLDPPELFSTSADDGTTLYGAFYRPEICPAPTVVSVYGGPGVQRVVDDWTMTANLRAQYLRSLGFCVLALDNRGTPRRGMTFESAISRQLGQVEVEDQVAGVRWAINAGLADPQRVGVTGWSYGGYMAAMCLARVPEIFRAAVAGAPVTSWDGYDTHYTERYMDTPAGNPDGYRSSAVMTHVEGVRGRLLLIHGLIDENVHFRHTARLVQTLVSAGIDHDLLLFPEERHMPRRETDRAFMEARLADFFIRHLSPASAPGA